MTRDRLIELLRNSGDVETWNYCTDDFKNPDPIESLAIYLIANGVTVNEWISVEERLPEKWQDVLIVTKHGDVRVDFIGILGGWYDAKDVTHWQPLPQPPKEVE